MDHGFEPVSPVMRFFRLCGVVALWLGLPAATAAPQPSSRPPATAPYRNARLSVERRVRDLVGRMTLEEKFWQLFMAPWDSADAPGAMAQGIFGLQVRLGAEPTVTAVQRQVAQLNAVQRQLVEGTRLGIPGLMFEEALHGLLLPQATVFPQAIGLAATWDTSLVQRVAAAVARETRSRGIRDVLSPVINIATDVRWGRTEETYGEDPWLTARMAVAFVRAFERAGVIATPKHFVANVGDGGRDSYPIELNARLLDELHFPPFRAALAEGGARSVMTSYNSVAGIPATQNAWLLRSTLKASWRFPGFVISDMSATSGPTVLHLTEASTATAAARAFRAGLDVVFQGRVHEAAPYLDAVRRGMVPVARIDDAVSRVLRAKFELGLFEHPYANVDSAAYWNDHPTHRALARDAARQSLVLLRNRGRLPFTNRPTRIAVMGLDATEGRLGGYSGSNARVVNILDGIRARAGESARVTYAAGPGRLPTSFATIPPSAVTSSGAPGWSAAYFPSPDLTGTPLFARQDPVVDFSWTLSSPGRGLTADWYGARWDGTVTIPAGSPRRIAVEANDGFRLFVDDTLRLDRWSKESAGTFVTSATLAPGSRHAIRLEFRETRGNGRVHVMWDADSADAWRAEIDRAVEAARASEVAVIVAGIEEGEFRDRASLALPGHQEALIRAVAATRTPTVVVLIGGSAITMSRWIDSVDAVIHAWYPGEEGGHAVAEVLWGDVNPSGRLPITFPQTEGQLPLVYNHRPTGRGDRYLDLPGEPLFPFGFGLSYTSFAYSDLRIDPASIAPSGTVIVRCRVRNTGTRAGTEVVQLYLRDLLASTSRPVAQLAGFTSVVLAPGEEREVAFRVDRTQLQMLDEAGHWVVEPGTFRVMVGASSRDIRLRGAIEVVPPR